MPTPGKKEEEDDFISRCIPIVIKDGTAKDQNHAATICFSIWRRRRGVANSVEELQNTAVPWNITPEQEEVKRALLDVKRRFGKFRKSAKDGADYRDPSPFGDEGIKCANCFFFYEDRKECRIVLDEINGDDVCKYWLINPQLVTKENNMSIENRKWDRKFINNLPDAAFAVIQKGGTKDSEGKTTPRSLRKLPHHKPGVTDGSDHKSVDLPHLRNALARLPQTSISDSEKASARAHLMKHAKALGVGGEQKMAEETPTETPAAPAEAPATPEPAPATPAAAPAAKPAETPAETPAEPAPAEATPEPEPAPAPVDPKPPVEPAPVVATPATPAPTPVVVPAPVAPVTPAPAPAEAPKEEPKPAETPAEPPKEEPKEEPKKEPKEEPKEEEPAKEPKPPTEPAKSEKNPEDMTPEERAAASEQEFLDEIQRIWGPRFP